MQEIRLTAVVSAMSAGDGATVIGLNERDEPVRLVLTQQSAEALDKAIRETVWIKTVT